MSMVSIETRQRLLEALGTPHGVTIVRKPTDGDDVIQVRMLSSNAVWVAVRVREFEGFQVEYYISKPGQAGHHQD